MDLSEYLSSQSSFVDLVRLFSRFLVLIERKYRHRRNNWFHSPRQAICTKKATSLFVNVAQRVVGSYLPLTAAKVFRSIELTQNLFRTHFRNPPDRSFFRRVLPNEAFGTSLFPPSIRRIAASAFSPDRSGKSRRNANEMGFKPEEGSVKLGGPPAKLEDETDEWESVRANGGNEFQHTFRREDSSRQNGNFLREWKFSWNHAIPEYSAT